MALDNFIPEIWSALLLENLKDALVFGSPSVINRNYDGEVSRYGDTVRINSIGEVSVDDYTKNADHMPPETLNDSQMVLVIDQAKMFNFQIDDIDTAQQNPKLMGAAMREAAWALASTADDYLADVINNGVALGHDLGGTPIVVSSNPEGVYEGLVDLSVVLDASNTPTEGRYAVVTPAIVGAMRKDARFASFGTDANRRVAAGGTRVLGEMAGFSILVSNRVPENGGNPQIIAGHNWATTFADQIESLEGYRPERRFADAMKGLHVYGSKVIRPELLAKHAVDFTTTTP